MPADAKKKTTLLRTDRLRRRSFSRRADVPLKRGFCNQSHSLIFVYMWPFVPRRTVFFLWAGMSVDGNQTYSKVRPAIEEISSREIAISWTAPVDTGKSPVTGYHVRSKKSILHVQIIQLIALVLASRVDHVQAQQGILRSFRSNV